MTDASPARIEQNGSEATLHRRSLKSHRVTLVDLDVDVDLDLDMDLDQVVLVQVEQHAHRGARDLVVWPDPSFYPHVCQPPA